MMSAGPGAPRAGTTDGCGQGTSRSSFGRPGGPATAHARSPAHFLRSRGPAGCSAPRTADRVRIRFRVTEGTDPQPSRAGRAAGAGPVASAGKSVAPARRTRYGHRRKRTVGGSGRRRVFAASSVPMGKQVPSMACRIGELVLECRDPEALARFWCEVLDFVVLDREEGAVEIGPREGFGGPQPTIVLSHNRSPRPGRSRLHIDVSPTDRDQDAELERLLKLGARPADVGQTGEESWHVLADPEGNEFCLLRSRIAPV